ncbi:MAG: SsrA-binding protein SmpB [Defluviitaleaceae bacterium]|nr:SsrA-binding protein SmpB [Defluviitaleaceae bacterium]
MEKKRSYKLISQNKKAFHDYFINETFQAGVELVGTEVKSLRQGNCNLKDSFVKIYDNQAYIMNMHISPYEHGNIFNKDPKRNRRLLLHRGEINRLIGATTREGYTIVPTKIYFSGSFVKVDIALAKGKKLYDKRRDIADKDMRREAQREYKSDGRRGE